MCTKSRYTKFIEQELLSKINNKSDFKKSGHYGKICFQEFKKSTNMRVL